MLLHTNLKTTLSLLMFFVYLSFNFDNPANAWMIKIPKDFPTIQEGIENARDGDTVFVAKGDYPESIDFLGKNIVVKADLERGAFLLDSRNYTNNKGQEIKWEINNEWQPLTTARILYDGYPQGVKFQSGENVNAILDGFEIVGPGHGIVCSAGSSPLIIRNSVSSAFSSHIYSIDEGTDPLIIKNIFSSENSNERIYVEDHSKPLISNNFFYGKYRPVTYIKISNADALLANNIFMLNQGNAISIYDGNAKIHHNTFIYSSYAISMVLYKNNSVSITNNIFNGNKYSIYSNSSYAPNLLEVERNDFWGNYSNYYSYYGIPGLGKVVMVNENGDSCDAYYNIFENPDYVDFDSLDFHLKDSSACVDAGEFTGVYWDIDGSRRPFGCQVDIGADEAYYPDVSCTIESDIKFVFQGDYLYFALIFENNLRSQTQMEAWLELITPKGKPYKNNPVGGPVSTELVEKEFLKVNRSLLIPTWCPEGYPYILKVKVGIFPDEIWDEDSLSFTVLNPYKE